MKKRLLSFIIMVIVCSLLFSVPAQATYVDDIKVEVMKQSGWQYTGKYHMGSELYWQDQINNKRWTGENRPEALMGDANIDGKVNAVDALFALYFGLYGNCQTAILISGRKTPPVVGWDSDFFYAYNKGTIERKADSETYWFDYCRLNSPFFADVTKDCVVNAKDALEILKYSVGKAKDFPVGNFTTIVNRFVYYPWPDEYYPNFFTDLYVEIPDGFFTDTVVASTDTTE